MKTEDNNEKRWFGFKRESFIIILAMLVVGILELASPSAIAGIGWIFAVLWAVLYFLTDDMCENAMRLNNGLIKCVKELKEFIEKNLPDKKEEIEKELE